MEKEDIIITICGILLLILIILAITSSIHNYYEQKDYCNSKGGYLSSHGGEGYNCLINGEVYSLENIKPNNLFGEYRLGKIKVVIEK